MPIFTFEKIPAPPRLGSQQPTISMKSRGRFGRLVDRLTEIRLRSYDARRRNPTTASPARKAKTG